MKGADAGTRVGKRRLCWRWIAAGGLEGFQQEAAAAATAGGVAAQRVAGQGGR